MHKRTGLSVGLLVLVLGSGAVAQSPSPEPPPWFGGRVEMPEHGFALTIPETWFAIDVSGDLSDQAAAVAERVCLSSSCEESLHRMLVGQRGWNLLVTMDVAGAETHDLADAGNCNIPVPTPVEGFTLDEVVPQMLAGVAAADDMEVVGQPRALRIADGPAYGLDSRVFPPEMVNDGSLPAALREGTSATTYVTIHDALLYVIGCQGVDPPEDRWLSIAETFEFLPAEE